MHAVTAVFGSPHPGRRGAPPIGDRACRFRSVGWPAKRRRQARPTSVAIDIKRRRESASRGQISLTGLCDRPYLQGLVKQNGRAFALDGTDELSVAGTEGFRGDPPAEQVRCLWHSATVSNLQCRSRGAFLRRAGIWLALRKIATAAALLTANLEPSILARFPTDIDARSTGFLATPPRQNSSS